MFQSVNCNDISVSEVGHSSLNPMNASYERDFQTRSLDATLNPVLGSPVTFFTDNASSNIHTRTYMYTYIYICIYVYVYL